MGSKLYVGSRIVRFPPILLPLLIVSSITYQT